MSGAEEHVSRNRDPGAHLDLPLTERLRRAPVSAALLALFILLFVATLAATLAGAPDPAASALRSLWTLELTESKEVLLRLGALELSQIWVDAEWWRVLTTSLLHGSLLHLVLNAVAFWSISEWIELECGRLHTWTVFTLASVGGGLASLAWCEAPIVLGASAGILGQAGALLLARLFGPAPLRERLTPISPLHLTFIIALCLVLGLLVPGIAQAGHLGGLLTGLLVGAAWLARTTVIRLSWLLALALLLGDLAWVGTAPTGRVNYYGILGTRVRDDALALEREGVPSAEQKTRARELFQRGLALAPDNANFRNEIAYQYALDGEELELAERLALEALALEPMNPSFLDTLAWIWCRQGSSAPALRVLHVVLYLDEDPSEEVRSHIRDCEAVFHVEPLEDVSRGTSSPIPTAE